MSKGIYEYDRGRAVGYAHRWAYDRNPVYYNYEKIGGDCTNFASQCIFAGSGVMNYGAAGGWYYLDANNKTPSWTGVQYLRNFLVSNTEGIGPSATEASISDMMPGDIIQLLFEGKVFQHSLVVVAVGAVPNADNILVATHTDDSDNRALNTYDFANIRFLHILSVRK